MDPALQELLLGPGDDVLECLVKLVDPARAPAGLRVVTQVGAIATGRMRRADIQAIWSDPATYSLKAPRLLEFGDAPDLQFGEVSAPRDERRPDSPERGRGQVVGVIDWGLDFPSPAFRRRDGGTRVIGLWDQRSRADSAGPAPFGYGRAFSRGEIDHALRTPDPYRALGYHPADSEAGEGAHGTHVADIACGNGRHGGPIGIAPEADIAFVQLSAGALSGLANLGDSVRMAEALHFLDRCAGPRNLCVNISVGRHAGPHTGLTLLEQMIDAFVAAKPGRAVVMSGGNYFEARAHASGRLVPGRADLVHWQTHSRDPTTNELEIWYPARDRVLVSIDGPDGVRCAEAALGRNTALLVGDREVGRLYHRAFDPNAEPPDHHINVFLYPDAPRGTWLIALTPVAVTDGRWHAWVERDAVCAGCQSVFSADTADVSSTIGSICNGFLSIAVGAVDTHTTPARLAHFSSSGPTRDGRQKPDLVAPGMSVLAAKSTPRSGDGALLTRKSGASQAAPHVTGALALIFEAAQRPLSIHETRAVLLGAAGPLDGDARRIGAGLLDLDRTLDVARAIAGASQHAHAERTREFAMNKTLLSESVCPSCAPTRVGVPLSFSPQEAARIFDNAYLGRGLSPAYAESFDLVALPGDRPASARAGDVAIHRELAGDGASVFLVQESGLPSLNAQEYVLLRPRLPVGRFGEQAVPAAAAGAGGAVGGASALVGSASSIWDFVDKADKGVQILERRVFNGSYALTASPVSATPYPRTLAQREPVTIIYEYTLKARHSLPGFSDQTFMFAVEIDTDCVNIYRIDFRPLYDRSSTMISSTFSINFVPMPQQQQPTGDPRIEIVFAIRGEWDPTGFGRDAFTGFLRLRSDGRAQISINGDRVRMADRKQVGAWPDCPPFERAPPKGADPTPVPTPDQGRRGGGYSGGGRRAAPEPDLIDRLPSGPLVRHVFFTTSLVRVTENEVQRLRQWFHELGLTLQTQIKNGGVPITVTGHASPVGPADQNFTLSVRRAEAAAAVLREILGAGALIRPAIGRGAQDAVGGPGSNAQADRRATIRLEVRTG